VFSLRNRNPDESLRRLHREAHDDPNKRANYYLALLRSGIISRQQLHLASLLNDSAATIIYQEVYHLDPSKGIAEADRYSIYRLILECLEPDQWIKFLDQVFQHFKFGSISTDPRLLSWIEEIQRVINSSPTQDYLRYQPDSTISQASQWLRNLVRDQFDDNWEGPEAKILSATIGFQVISLIFQARLWARTITVERPRAVVIPVARTLEELSRPQQIVDIITHQQIIGLFQNLLPPELREFISKRNPDEKINNLELAYALVPSEENRERLSFARMQVGLLPIPKVFLFNEGWQAQSTLLDGSVISSATTSHDGWWGINHATWNDAVDKKAIRDLGNHLVSSCYSTGLLFSELPKPTKEQVLATHQEVVTAALRDGIDSICYKRRGSI